MDDLITALQALLVAQFSTYTVVYGEVKVPSDGLFPLIEVIPIRTTFNRAGTGGLSDNEYNIQINYKNTLKKFVSNNTNKTKLDHLQDAVKVMEERNATTKDPNPSTILGVLLANLQIDGKVQIMKDFEISYDVNEYAGTWVVMASLTFNALQKTPLNC